MAKHRLTAADIATFNFASLPQAQQYPAMQLFAADWLSGLAVQSMTPEQGVPS